ncbi:hypothetical protein K6V78_03590 [Streptococcus gallolyticus]|nr:hypothetical protein [Streptococcus gallolyticus]MBY5040698.1 hypothetical protein [Streptococcus gallolyticus]
MIELGFHPRLVHGLIAEVFSKYTYDEVPKIGNDSTVKYIYKKYVIILLKNLETSLVK